ncbi:MAG: alpha-E domain-containing protein [Pedosphaera sp.]|nr:alpha-E domain-containing protein [Pedosphaera sp.]
MLSRVANCLYWMSRYVERAENIARIVDVNLQLLLDLRNLDEKRLEEHWLPIVQTTGDEELFFQLHKQARGKLVTEFLVFQMENPNSIITSICQARENARMVRDQITLEYWEELNRLYWFMRTSQGRQAWKESPTDFFQQIKGSSLLLMGLSRATSIRNEGWYFSEAGKFLERADKTSRILDVRYMTLPEKGVPGAITQAEALEWSAILRSCSGWDAYKSIHGAEVHPKLVVEFLLFNADFPRSVRFCVNELNVALRRISGVPEGKFCNDAEKLAGRLVAEMQFSTIDEVFDQGLHGYLDQLQFKLNAIGGALFNAYIFQPFTNLEEEIMVQQEEQQQQQSGESRTPILCASARHDVHAGPDDGAPLPIR